MLPCCDGEIKLYIKVSMEETLQCERGFKERETMKEGHANRIMCMLRVFSS